MVISAVMCANAFNGLNTAAWTGWVVFAVTIGPILVWAYTVRALFECSDYPLLIFLRPSIPSFLQDGSTSLFSEYQ